VPFNLFISERGHASRHFAINWNIRDSKFLVGRNQRSGFPRLPVDETLALQDGNVLHHRCLTAKAEVVLNFARARGNSFLPLLVLNELQDVSLPISKH
jgi:hypothetical protein